MDFKVKSATANGFTLNLSRLAFVISLFTFYLWAGGIALAQYSFPSAKNPVLDIFFIDSLQGWILESENNSAVLFHTVDGGNSWSRLGTQPPIYKLFFLNSVHGWALTVEWPQPDAPLTTLHETRDGGHTWLKRSVVLPSKPNRADMILGFWFLDETRGWFVGQGELGTGLAFETTDGGQSMHQVDQIPREDILYDVYGRDKDKLWVFGTNTITATFDGGRTWHSQVDSTRIPKDLGHIALRRGVVLNTGAGWAVGVATRAIILSTKDFGRTWNISLDSPEGNWLTDVTFLDPHHGCAVGASTTLYCTSDGGRNWTARHVLPKAVDAVASTEGINVDNSFKKILMLNATRTWVLSEGGFLFQTDDGGSTWRQCRPQTTKRSLTGGAS
jgi:photosystem II stability/assembly factor-like uncharacterized protein